MTSRQKQSALYDLQQEKQTLRKLEIVYRDALDSVNEKIAELDARTDTQNRQSIAYQKQFQESLKNQLDDILQELAQKSYRTTDEYLKDSYINGCVETVYQMHGDGIPVCMPIPQERVTRAVRLDSALSKPLYQSVGEDIAQLKKSITDVVAMGFASGTSADDMASQIAGKMIGDYSNMAGGALWRAKLIARTESNRIANAARLDTAKDAKEQTGADLVKQWSSALDARTRPHHIALHGQVRELDEGFEIAGRIGSAPCHFGIASEDCNCRCRANTVPRWAVDDDAKRLPLKDDANYVDIDADGYEEFKGKYLDELKRLGERTGSGAEAVDVDIPMPETNGGDGKMYQPEKIGGKALTFGEKSGILSYSIKDRIINMYNSSEYGVFDLEAIEDDLQSTYVGKEISLYIEKNNVYITMDYDIDIPRGYCGSTIGKNDITVYAVNHGSIREVTETIVHEASHIMFNWGGTKEAEVNCKIMEVIHSKGDITESELERIVAQVKLEYNDLPEGDLYGY